MGRQAVEVRSGRGRKGRDVEAHAARSADLAPCCGDRPPWGPIIGDRAVQGDAVHGQADDLILSRAHDGRHFLVARQRGKLQRKARRQHLGAQFTVGDGHAVQGDGEVCITAVETALTGRFRLSVLKGMELTAPRAETPTHYITMGFDEDLDDAVRQALRDMIRWIGELRGLSNTDAYTLCSLAADLRVTQMVNMAKGAHCMLPKSILS